MEVEIETGNFEHCALGKKPRKFTPYFITSSYTIFFLCTFFFVTHGVGVEAIQDGFLLSTNLTLSVCLHVQDVRENKEKANPLHSHLHPNPHPNLKEKRGSFKRTKDCERKHNHDKKHCPHFVFREHPTTHDAGHGVISQDHCGYKSCPKSEDGMLNVHLVPHSHDDVGWLKTIDEYYNGDKMYIQDVEIRKIITNVIEELEKSPDRRYIQVETAYFWRWWEEQDGVKREAVKRLVESGQLEFASGGWAMNDEGTCHYNAIIDQFTLGLRFLNETFGPCAIPRVGWQIDPFGHSKEHASISAALGFDGLFFARIHYQDRERRIKDKEMEMIWSADDKNRGEDAWLFTSYLYNHYEPPHGFCFDTILCSEGRSHRRHPLNATSETHDKEKGHKINKRSIEIQRPLTRADEITEKNINEKLTQFEHSIERWAKTYQTNNILITMGKDFSYQDAEYWYDNLDKLIKGFNDKKRSGGKLNLFYSTPSCYVHAVNQAGAGVSWPVKKDDFFPYENEAHASWAGYFTSRPTFKYYVLHSSNFLQACKQLGLELTEGADNSKVTEVLHNIFKLEEAVAVTQHHDGVTGTSKQAVHNDYSLRLFKGIQSCQKVVQGALQKLEGDTTEFTFCPLLNITVCPATEESKSGFVVSVYNPLVREVSNTYIRLPVSTKSGWKVHGHSGEIKSQLVPIPQLVLEIPGRQGNGATHELVFPAGNLPGLSFTNFKVTPSGQHREEESDGDTTHHRHGKHDIIIKNSVGLELAVDGVTGLPKKLKSGHSEVDLEQNFYYYVSRDDYYTKPSGAYIFAPDGGIRSFQEAPKFKIFKGNAVTEIQVTINDAVSQVIRVYDKSYKIEFEWLVGPLPGDEIGREFIMKFKSNLETNKTFFTDANGRQLVKRVRDHQDTYKYKVDEPISGNYYPINSRILITEGGKLEANKKTLIFLNDRSQGGSSINDGEVEIMLNRRCFRDDSLGLGEELNERAFGKGLVARGKIWLVFAGDKTGHPISIHRPLAQETFMDRILAFRPLSGHHKDEHEKIHKFHNPTQYSKLAEVLPKNCHLLTFQRLSKNQILIRFEHIYERGEDQNLSKEIIISYQKLKHALNFKSIRETTLGANQWKDEASRLKWKVKEHEKSSEHLKHSIRHSKNSEADIHLLPFEIRTFIASL